MKKLFGMIFGTFAMAVAVSTFGADASDSSDKLKIVSQQINQNRVGALQQNAQSVSDNSGSTANSLLGGLSSAATGIGGMQLAQGLSEQSADTKAADEMETLRSSSECDIAGISGKNASGGETQIDLPGYSAEFISARSEYISLAEKTKQMKDELKLQPGIESEVIIDKSELYSNGNSNSITGQYDTAEERLESGTAKKRIIAGGVLTAAGVVGGIVGDKLINRNATGNKSDEINSEFDKQLAAAARKLESEINVIAEEKEQICPDGSNGTPPYCQCAESNMVYFGVDKGCQPCPSNKVSNSDKTACVCPDSMLAELSDGTCVAVDTTPDCYKNSKDPLVTLMADGKTCSCDKGFDYNSGTNKCECNSPKREKGGECITVIVEKTINTIVQTQIQEVYPDLVVLPSDGLFKSGTSTLMPKAETPIALFAGRVSTLIEANFEPQNKDYSIIITGHADKVPFKKNATDGHNGNLTLSQQRADSVKEFLVKNGINPGKIIAIGYGDYRCEDQKLVANPNCRVALIKFVDKKDVSNDDINSMIKEARSQGKFKAIN